MKRWLACLSLVVTFAAACRETPPQTLSSSGKSAGNPLPSWNEGSTRKSIVDFVARVTKEGSSEFVPVPERIATFDNDGTLWAEKPFPFQLFFAIDRVKSLAAQHPEWQAKQPFASLLRGDMAGAMSSGEKGLLEIVCATHAGMTVDDFSQVVLNWIHSARHPQTGRPYTEMVYQPMIELLAYLRSNGFKTFIVSGGGVEFMRAWTDEVYGIPPEQVVGSSGKLHFEWRDGTPVLIKQAALDFVDDKEDKPVAIQSRIGRRPIAAFGNSDVMRNGESFVALLTEQKLTKSNPPAAPTFRIDVILNWFEELKQRLPPK